MAFIRSNLYLLGAPASPRRIWLYDTLDTAATVDTTGYFNAAANEMRVGDIVDLVVWVTTVYTGTVTARGRAIVNANAAGVVDTSDFTADTMTDTD